MSEGFKGRWVSIHLRGLAQIFGYNTHTSGLQFVSKQTRVPLALLLLPALFFQVSQAIAHETNLTNACVGESDAPCYTQWWGQLDALWLTRDDGDKITLAEERRDPAAGTADAGRVLNRLTTHSSDFGFEPGLRMRLGRRLGNKTDIAFAYFGLHDWKESESLLNSDPNGNNNPANLPNRLFSAGLNGSNANTYNVIEKIEVELSTQLDSLELNLRHPIITHSTNFLWGFRYLNIKDKLKIHAEGEDIVGDNVTDRTRVRVRNHLVGAQLGMDHRIAASKAWADLSVKGGLFANFNEQRINQRGITPTTFIDLDGDDVSLGQMLETQITVAYSPMDNVSFHAGYQLLIISGLALAPEQLDLVGDAANFSVPVQDSSAGTDDSGSIVFHGPHVGLEIRW